MFAQPFVRASIAHDFKPSTRDDLLTKLLRIEDQPTPSQPIYSKTPIFKTFHYSDTPSPLESLLVESRLLINTFQIQLPYTTNSQTPKKIKPQTKIVKNKSTGTKRVRHNEDCNLEGDVPQSSIYTTPIPIKTIFFSPATAAKKRTTKIIQSTPVPLLKEHHSKNERSPKKLLKLDSSKTIEIIADSKTEESIGDSKPKEFLADSTLDYSDYDHLACHADNIMRMAVDSTMLGSSFNSTFSNTFANDSVLGGQKNYPDFFDDEDYDRSVLESLKPKWTLAKLKATRIEINAEDLHAAVNA